MAVSPSYKVTQTSDGKTIYIREMTGAYSATNVIGYGNPNPATSAFTIATLKVEKRNSDGTWTTAPSGSAINVHSGSGGIFPATNNALRYSLTAETCGYGTDASFADGIYRLTFTYTGTFNLLPLTIATEKYIYLIHDIECCNQEMSERVATCACNCQGLKDKFSEMMLHRRILKGAICGGNLSVIQKSIDFLTDLCSECGCGCS